MSNKHPIDEHFSRKLQYYAGKPPMHLWDRIDAHRSLQRQQILNLRKRLGLLVLLLFLMGASVSGFLMQQSASGGENGQIKPNLGNFPIPAQPMAKTPGDPASNVIALVETTNKSISKLHNSSSLLKKTAKTNFFVPTPIESSSIESLPISSESADKTPSVLPGQAGEEKIRLGLMQSLSKVKPFARRRHKFSEDIQCADFNPGEKGRWFLDVTASPDWSFRTLQAKERKYADYVESREATESPHYNYSVGMRLAYQHQSGWSGKIGLNYSQINEKFEHQSENEEVITIRNIYGPDGDVVGTDTLIETGTLRNFSNNRFQTLDIPLVLGYEKALGEKFSLGLNAGVLLNLNFNSKGDFLSPNDMQPVSFSTEQPGSYPAFREKLGLGWYMGASLSYQISPKLFLLLEPHLKSYPKTVTSDQYMVSQKYLMTGLSVGIRHAM